MYIVRYHNNEPILKRSLKEAKNKIFLPLINLYFPLLPLIREQEYGDRRSKADEAGTSTSNATPEYNTNSVQKAKLQSTLAALLNDPVLADVPKKPSLSDVDTLINLELGSAMRITVLKMDGTSFDVAVMDSATVKDLKLAIKKKVNEVEESRMGHRHISWKHVWANFCLSHHTEKLLNDDSELQVYGLRNNSQVQFVPYVMARAFKKHSRRRKHRFFHGLNRKA